MRSRTLKLAFVTAEASTHPITKVGAVLFKGSSVIKAECNTTQYIGYRQADSNNRLFGITPTRHAELNALHNVREDVLRGADLLVVRVTKLGDIRSAKPCPACMASVVRAGIRKVYYSTDDGTIESLTISALDVAKYIQDNKRHE